MRIKDVRDVLRAGGRDGAGAVLNSFPVSDWKPDSDGAPVGKASVPETFAAPVEVAGADEWAGVSALLGGGEAFSLVHFIGGGGTLPVIKVHGPAGCECLTVLELQSRLASASPWRSVTVNAVTDANGLRIAQHRLLALRFSASMALELQSRVLWRLRELGLPLAAVVNEGARLHALIVVDAGDVMEYRSTARELLEACEALGIERSTVGADSEIPLPGSHSAELWFMEPLASRIRDDQLLMVRDAVRVAVAASEQGSGQGEPVLDARAFDTAGNDRGNSELFVKRWSEVLRYVPRLKTWLVLKGGLWRRDEAGRVVEMAKAVSDELMALAATLKGDAQKAGVARALRMGEAGRLAKMIELAQSDPRIAVEAARLDANAMLVGVGNGVLDLASGDLLTDAEASAALITKRLGCEFAPDAKCPVWERFVADVCGDSAALVRYFRQLAGYCLTGLMEEQTFQFFFGGGANGKTVFTETLCALLGDYAARADDSILVASANAKPGASLARLPGVRLLVGSETSEGQRLNESLVKQITGGDTITAEPKYCAPFDFKPTCKLVLFGNHKPVIRGTDGGIWRRVRLVPFTVTVAQEKRDSRLPERLRAELSGILNWAIEGLHDWAANGRRLAVPECVTAASDEYRTDSDWLADFIDERLEQLAGFTTSKKDVFLAYSQWSRDEGLSYPLAKKALSRRLKERGFVESSAHYWSGVRLRVE